MKPILLLIYISLSTITLAQNIANIGLETVEVNGIEKVYNFYVWDYENIVASQFSMTYDGAKMTYKEIRNSQVDGLSGSSFSNPQAGVLLTSWIDLDLQAESYIDSTVLYQIVFDIIVPGGSNLCFADTPLGYEFVNEEEELNQIIIHDDCNSGLLLVLNPTGIKEAEEAIPFPLSQVHLTKEGELTFSISTQQWLSLNLYSNTGQLLYAFPGQLFTVGRHTLHINTSILSGIYFLKSKGEVDIEVSKSVFAY